MAENFFVPAKPAKNDFAQGDALPQSAPELTACLAAIDAEETAWQEYIRQLSAGEDPAKGVFFAAELHEARQHKMQLSYLRACCKGKINRLRLGEEGF